MNHFDKIKCHIHCLIIHGIMMYQPTNLYTVYLLKGCFK